MNTASNIEEISIIARPAVKGLNYFFHTEYQGEEATIQVSSNGKIIEAQGPSNTYNKAVEWGSRYLREWGRELPK